LKDDNLGSTFLYWDKAVFIRSIPVIRVPVFLYLVPRFSHLFKILTTLSGCIMPKVARFKVFLLP